MGHKFVHDEVNIFNLNYIILLNIIPQIMISVFPFYLAFLIACSFYVDGTTAGKPEPPSKGLTGWGKGHQKYRKGADSLVVLTTEGYVEGELNTRGIRVWKGLRYAAPPVGDLRWSDPVPPFALSWSM